MPYLFRAFRLSPAAVFLLFASLSLPADAQEKASATPAPSAPPAAALPIIRTEAENLPVTLPASSPSIRYSGRFDTRDAAGPRCTWPASAVSITFIGNALNVKINESGDSDRYEVVVNGKPTAILAPATGTHVYSVFTAPKPEGENAAPPRRVAYTVSLVKRTENFFGTTQFQAFQLTQGGAPIAALPAKARRIEVIGDSISCGYGNEGKDQKEHFSADTENAYLTYGAIAARELGAEYTCLAWSGRKMWPDNTLDEIYGRTLATDPGSVWDFTRAVPDAVIITLGTNDFAGKPPEEKGWIAGYGAFIARVRKNYPNALVYCATSPMMGGKDADTLHDYLKKIVDAANASGGTNVRLLEFATQDAKNGFGADWHPSVATHQIMAVKLTETLRNDLKW